MTWVYAAHAQLTGFSAVRRSRPEPSHECSRIFVIHPNHVPRRVSRIPPDAVGGSGLKQLKESIAEVLRENPEFCTPAPGFGSDPGELVALRSLA